MDGALPHAAENPFGHAALLGALDLHLRHREIVVTGVRADDFARAALRTPFLDRTLLRAPRPEALPEPHPARSKIAAAPATGAAFVCIGEVCSLPITDPERIAAAGS
jgi:hypothetical protein